MSKNILILFTGNSYRSILAEAILQKLGSPRFNTFSAGSFPKGEINANAIKLLKKLGYDTSHLRPKSWDDVTSPRPNSSRLQPALPNLRLRLLGYSQTPLPALRPHQLCRSWSHS
jgi:Low molecular weight phosphotyrosine protein phosphatase